MKCQLCDGKGEYMHAIGGYRPCEHCNGTGKIKVTNEEWFNSLPIRTKAVYLTRIQLGHRFWTQIDLVVNGKDCPNKDEILAIIRDWELWLEGEHEE